MMTGNTIHPVGSVWSPCDYLDYIMRNIDMKPHHLVQIWAMAFASARPRGNVQMPVEWGTPSWDDRIRLTWKLGVVHVWPERCQNPDVARRVITVRLLRCGNISAVQRADTGSAIWFEKKKRCNGTSCFKARSIGDLITNDNWLDSKHKQGERLKRLQCSYSQPGPWCNASPKQKGEVFAHESPVPIGNRFDLTSVIALCCFKTSPLRVGVSDRGEILLASGGDRHWLYVCHHLCDPQTARSQGWVQRWRWAWGAAEEHWGPAKQHRQRQESHWSEVQTVVSN